MNTTVMMPVVMMVAILNHPIQVPFVKVSVPHRIAMGIVLVKFISLMKNVASVSKVAAEFLLTELRIRSGDSDGAP